MALEFARSERLSVGVELELQLVNLRDYNLTRGASDLLAAIARRKFPGEIKPEVTESMIEIATSVHRTAGGLAAELGRLRDILGEAAEKLNLGIAGGGTHPFQKWTERRIHEADRFKRVSELYGYLAKQFTVFGQHIHIGCDSPDDAIYLIGAMGRYVPHFIALAASSPFFQGADTLFDSARLNTVAAFPLAGTMPEVTDWSSFNAYFERMSRYGIVTGMKDFYWDIRPKPEFGTIEIRVCDTPLGIERAAGLAAFAQSLAALLLTERPVVSEHAPLVYAYNRFQACRFGFDAFLVDPLADSAAPIELACDLSALMPRLMPYAERLGAATTLAPLVTAQRERHSDARTLRSVYEREGAFSDVVRAQLAAWRR